MNPHDVLGIRANASSQELELAYRSRRAQYHPDKYLQSDAETVLWATTKMQEVNAAYAQLSTPRQARSVEPVMQSATSTRADTSALAPMTLKEYFSHTGLEQIQTKAIHFAPAIPSAKLRNAVENYANGIRAEDVLVLVDETFWGSAKEGAVITGEKIVFSAGVARQRLLDLSALSDLSCEDNKLASSGRAVAAFSSVEPLPNRAVFSTIGEFVRLRERAKTQASLSSALDPQMLARVQSFVPCFLKPEFFDKASVDARNRHKRTPGYLLADEINDDLMRLVRFKCAFQQNEELLAFSLLAINGQWDYFFCVTTHGVHSVPPDLEAQFLDYSVLKACTSVEHYDEGRYCGVQLSGGQRLRLSNKNVSVRPVGVDLVAGLIELLNAREPRTPLEQKPSTEATVIFTNAKDRLILLCECIQALEEETERQLIDRENAFAHFEVLEAALTIEEARAVVLPQLELIAALCQSAMKLVGHRNAEVAQTLLERRDADPKLVVELRTVLLAMMLARQESLRQAQRQAKEDAFFER